MQLNYVSPAQGQITAEVKPQATTPHNSSNLGLWGGRGRVAEAPPVDELPQACSTKKDLRCLYGIQLCAEMGIRIV